MRVTLTQQGRFTLMQALSDRVNRMVELTTEDEAKRLRRNIQKRLKRRFTKGTGALAASVQLRKRRTFASWEVFSDEPHAVIRELGGVIKPKRSGRPYIAGRRKDGSLRIQHSQGKRLAIPHPNFRDHALGGKPIDEIADELSGGQTFGTWASKSGNTLWLRIGRGAPMILAALAPRIKVKGKPVWVPEHEKSTKRLGKALVRRLRRFGESNVARAARRRR